MGKTRQIPQNAVALEPCMGAPAETRGMERPGGRSQ